MTGHKTLSKGKVSGVDLKGVFTMGEFAIFRHDSLNCQSRGKGSIGQALRHLDNHSKSAEISRPELTHLNQRLIGEDLTYKQVKELANEYREKHNKNIDEWNKEHPERKRRHLKTDANQFIEFVATLSPEMENKIDVDEWIKTNVSFIKNLYEKEYGCKLLRLDVHRDEACVHVQGIALSWNVETQTAAARDVIGNSKRLSELQDRYAQEMEPFGLQRGVSRYKEYQSIKKRALNEGLSVPEYALKYNIEIPKRRKHKSIPTWKAEEQQKGIELENYIDKLEETVNFLKERKESLELLEFEYKSGAIIPEHFIKLQEERDNYLKLLKIGQRYDFPWYNDERITFTNFLIKKLEEEIENNKTKHKSVEIETGFERER